MLLKIQELKKYYKDIKAVDDISFEVEKGDILGLLGTNGAGKSTAISIIATLISADSGKVFFKGVDIAKNPKELQNCLGLVPQEIALYPNLSGWDNLAFWGKAYGLKGEELKKRIIEIADIIGIKERLKDKVKKYSGGMQRRLNIGAALLHRPELIIMDEPTVGIDPQSRNHILETTKTLAKEGATIIYTSHYMEEVELLCNKVCIMDKGKIIANGTKEELINSIGEDYKITIKLANDNAELIEKLKVLDCVKALDYKDNTLDIVAKGEETSSNLILATITESAAKLLSYDMQKANLETVFLNLTGRALRD